MKQQTTSPVPSVTGSSIFTRLLVGLGSGALGSMIIGIVLLATWGMVGDTLLPTDVSVNEFGVAINERQNHPLFLSIIILAMFLSTMAASVAYSLLSSATDPQYTLRSTLLTQNFFGSIVILLFCLPMYVVGNSMFGAEGLLTAGLLHATFIALFTYLVMQVVHKPKHIIVHMYGLILGLAMMAGLAMILVEANQTVFIFLFLPILFAMVGLGTGIAQNIYAWMYESYGSDMLSTDTRFGSDFDDKGRA